MATHYASILVILPGVFLRYSAEKDSETNAIENSTPATATDVGITYFS